MKKGIIIIGLLLAAGASHAQHRQLLLGDSLYVHKSFAKAVRHYEKALKKADHTNLVHEKLGNTYYRLQRLEEALEQYSIALEDHEKWAEETRWNYLHVQHTLGNPEKVREYISRWGALNGELAGSMQDGLQAEDLFYMDSAAYEVALAPVNSGHAEFAPSYFRDGLVFASSRKEGNTSSRKYHWDGSYYLDLYYAPVNSGPSDNYAIRPVGSNTTYHDGPVVFFENDTKVIFTRNESGRSRDGMRTLVLMQADVTASGTWENIKPLPVNNDHYSVAHPALSTDEKILYFVSDMPGGHGGTDIWQVTRSASGWEAPVNLGPSVNTPGNEMFPSVWGDQLFFASDGHPGLGGLDIFIAEKYAQDSYMVRNAGYPMNTRRDDFGLITRNGRQGYFSSNRAGQDDIYSFVRDKILVDIFYVDRQDLALDSVNTLADGQRIASVGDRTHLELPVQAVTGFQASRTGYADTTFSIETNDEFYIARTIPMTRLDNSHRGTLDVYPIASENNVDLYLGTQDELIHLDNNGKWLDRLSLIRVEETPGLSVLEGLGKILGQNGYEMNVKDTITAIFFDFDKSTIRKTEKTNLSRLISLLERYPEANVVISAHADARGTHAYNDKLGNRRALATRDYLISSGISSSRIISKSYGERQLWIDCEECTESQHQLNRRATFGVDKEK